MKKDVQPTSIKLEKQLLERIKADAERDGRSTTKQIEYMIKKYYEIKENIKD